MNLFSVTPSRSNSLPAILIVVIFLSACQRFFAEQPLSPRQKIMDHCETVSKVDAGKIDAKLPYTQNAEPGARLNRNRIIEITQKASYQGCLQRFAEGKPTPETKP